MRAVMRMVEMVKVCVNCRQLLKIVGTGDYCACMNNLCPRYGLLTFVYFEA